MADTRQPGLVATEERQRQPLRTGGRAPGSIAGPVPASARLAPSGRGVHVPHVLLGCLLVLVCGAVFYLISAQSSGRVPVLALARDVSAGHVLTAGDLRVVQVAAGADVSTVSAANTGTVVGGVMAAPRTVGALLSPSDVGQAKFPPPGEAVAAVALKDGQFPPGLSAGTKVAALVAAPTQSGTGSGSPTAARASWLPGVVVSVQAADSGSAGTVVALLMSTDDAATLGAASAQAGAGSGTGAVSLVVLPPAGDVTGR